MRVIEHLSKICLRQGETGEGTEGVQPNDLKTWEQPPEDEKEEISAWWTL
jgi:hypothetical protein